jgi:flagellar motor switch protein FliM
VKPERVFTAASVAANHAPCLQGRAAAPEMLLTQLERLGETMARLLAPLLAPLCGGEEPLLRVIAPERQTEGALAAQIGPLAANALLAQSRSGDRILLSIDARAVMAQLDRAFGGSGAMAEDLPRAIPRSADIFAQRLETLAAQALGTALGLPDAEAPRIAARDAQYRMLAPFPAGAELALLVFEIAEQGGGNPWRITLATRFAALPRLLGGQSRRAPTTGDSHSPLAEPFAGIRLPLEARLVDMPIKLSRLAGLKPGMTIPIALERQVPLRIGGAVVARGTVGEMDDRIALQITQTQLSSQEPTT